MICDTISLTSKRSGAAYFLGPLLNADVSGKCCNVCQLVYGEAPAAAVDFTTICTCTNAFVNQLVMLN